MQQVQVCIVGAGAVGLTLALGLAKQNMSVQVIDSNHAPAKITDAFSNRVSAVSLTSQKLFSELGVWNEIRSLRATPYTHMDVRDQDSFGKINFNSNDLDLPELGHIIENDVIRYALYTQLATYSNVQLMFNTRYQSIHQTGSDVLITLESGLPVMAKLLIAADGANSAIRTQFKMPLTFWDYDHHAIVATVKTLEEHNHTARQIFLPTGPLAFLPLADEHHHSIVWSTSPEHAKELMAMTNNEFNKALNVAIDAQCGLCEVANDRAVFPLQMRYAQQWVNDKVVLMGDAAHTIHPLAGLGMNLGLKDAACLIDTLVNEQLGEFASYRALRHYERNRKLDAQKHIATMQGLKVLFEGAHPVKKLLRGVGLSMVDNLGPIKSLFAQEAIGK